MIFVLIITGSTRPLEKDNTKIINADPSTSYEKFEGIWSKLISVYTNEKYVSIHIC